MIGGHGSDEGAGCVGIELLLVRRVGLVGELDERGGGLLGLLLAGPCCGCVGEIDRMLKKMFEEADFWV